MAGTTKSSKKDLEAKIAELEEKLAKLATQFESKPKTKPEIITESVVKQPIIENTTVPDIDAILTEWSWRCDKGYPDINNPMDKIKLQEVLDEMGVDLPFDRLVEAKPKSKEDIEPLIVLTL